MSEDADARVLNAALAGRTILSVEWHSGCELVVHTTTGDLTYAFTDYDAPMGVFAAPATDAGRKIQMSYNIGSIIITGGRDPYMLTADVARMVKLNLPEDCFLRDLAPADGRLPVRNLNWCGEGSGSTWETFQRNVAPCIFGMLEGVVIWENGDSVTGFKIENNKFTEMKVGFVLTPEGV